VIEIDDRHRELLRTLAGARVQFVLVGGVALQLRGFSGATRDLDITNKSRPQMMALRETWWEILREGQAR
jgi:hypothetical protein